MARPTDDVFEKTQEQLKNHYGDDVKRAIEEIVGEEPKKEGQGEGFPSTVLVRNVFELGKAGSTPGAIPAPDNPSGPGGTRFSPA